ncbi:uncharacterized protein LOC134274153 [Saccostrea cucullata]|uniref:uncharacterized protein LOC134274153 n=1 Tax=Saccostrea cuccullata TaxID=36930 RepID=UPI002ED3B6F8
MVVLYFFVFNLIVSHLNTIWITRVQFWILPAICLNHSVFLGFTWFLFAYFLYNVHGARGLLHLLSRGREKLLFCVMGNDTSSVPSEANTPVSPSSEWQSVYSVGSKRRSSVSSTRLPTPTEPPEPDLSHLSEDEIRTIRSVIGRAKTMQQEEQQRIRKLEEDYIAHATTVEQRALSVETEKSEVHLCPICLKNELSLDEPPGIRSGQNICNDCGVLTCSDCGAFQESITSKLQDWVCVVCGKRRKLVFSTGLWHPGIHPTDDIPLEKELASQLDKLKTEEQAKPPLKKSTSIDQAPKRPPLPRQKSLPVPVVLPKVPETTVSPQQTPSQVSLSGRSDVIVPESSESEDYATLPAKAKFSSALWNMVGSCAMGPMGRSAHSRSDSESSDVTSDVDMVDVSMQYQQGDAISPDDGSDDYSMMSIGSSGEESLKRKPKHRPKSLSIPRSQSATSSDDETSDSNVSTDTECRLAHLEGMDGELVARAASAFAEEMEDFQSHDPWKELQLKPGGDLHDDMKKRSPYAPRSPSWREGLESPPFSPRRRDSYPGKKRGSPTRSPKERHHFTFAELPTSPTAKQPQSETDVLYAAEYPDDQPAYIPGVHPLDDKNVHGYASGYDKEGQREHVDIVDYECEPRIIARIPESTACMDLATYAATIASNTANLTQMSVSPTNLNVHSNRENMISPDSQGSNGSASPISPGYYEHGTIPEEDEEEEEIELADPSSKSIDYQGSKRQKARPPSTDWSPVIDLSPILDVSPSIEEAEQEDMLVIQEQERRRRESQEEDTSGEESKHFFQPVKEEDDLKSFYGLKRYDRVEDICKLLDVPASEFEDIKKSPDTQGNVSITNTAGSSQMAVTTTEQPFVCTTSVSSNTTTTDIPPQTSSENKIKLNMSNVLNSSKGKMDSVDAASPSSDKSDGKGDGKSKESKVRRKLPEPTADMIAQHSRKKKPLPPLPPTTLQKDPESEQKNKNYATVIIPERKFTSAASKSLSEPPPAKNLKDQIQKQDSEERRRRAKDLKAKPDPLLIQHIEAEEKSLSPQYKVLDSPPSPESRSSLKRDYSDSTSVSPSSSPDRELYPFPSPVTPPDSDSSPPKPHSPSSPGTDNFEDDGEPKDRAPSAEPIYECIFPVPAGKTETVGKVTTGRGRSRRADQSAVDGKKVRRKLPPLPPEEAGATPPPIPPKPKSYSAARRNPPRHRSGYITPSSTSDESMNEEDFEVAMLTKQRRMNDLDKPSLDRWNGNYLPPDMDDSKVRKNVKQMYNEDVKANIPPDGAVQSKVGAMDQYNKEKDETDQIIDSLITIYGVPITQAMKSLKKRLQDELRRVTEGRRRRIEEIEEIRALQAQICELKLSQDYAKVQAKRNAQKQAAVKPAGPSNKKRGSVPMAAPRSSPQVMPRRSRHKRQSSDPMISKFSPIKEDKDIEADFQLKAHKETTQKYITDDSSQSGLSDNESIRSEPAFNARVKKTKPSAYTDMFFNQNTPKRKPNIESSSSFPSLPPKCHSDTSLPEKVKSKGAVYVSDDDETKAREDRKQKLQQEIDKRKKKLEETTKLKTELFNLTRPGQVMAHSYDDIPRKSSRTFPSTRPIPTGIIKPLEDDEDFDDVSDDNEFVTRSHQEISKASVVDSNEANYSSSEYLAHKQESVRRRLEDVTSYSSPYLYTGSLNDSRVSKTSKQKVDFYLDPAARDAVITSSVTLPDLHSKRTDVEYHASKDYGAVSDTETSPPSDSTPAMPLLADVKEKSRQIIHGIGTGSRPVSAEFNFSGGVEDLMNGMHRVESDNSVDADEPIMKHMMEGGVTILKQLERKKQPPRPQPKVYDFPIKRILLTRDPKDRSIKAGNGLGMKIVGGRTIPGTKTVGAYVAAIYQGGVAEQLLGELQEGDQILEWNGIDLSDKTYEEVQKIICQPNGEIELVVRPAPYRTGGSKEEEGCVSSYDNLEFVSDDVYEKCIKSNHGVDPGQLAAQLEGIKETGSPNTSQSSSQPDYYTPSVSSQCSSPRSDPASTSSDRQRGTSSDDRNHRTSIEDRQMRTSLDERSHRTSVEDRQMRTSLDERSQRTSVEERQMKSLDDRPQRTMSNDRIQRSSLEERSQRTKLEERSPRSSLDERQRRLNMAPEDSNQKGNSLPRLESVDKVDKCTQQEEKDWGEIQLQLSHDEYESTLHIHVIQARNLKPKDINGQSDPFVKIYLLPGRCSENKRRTKHISRTLNPEWHQTVVFQNLHHEEVKYKTLEITVWDYDRFKANDFLGEVVIDLSVEGMIYKIFLKMTDWLKPHWGVELPKPTVLPPAGRTNDVRKTLTSQSVYRTSRKGGDKPEAMGRRRRSLGNLADVDRSSTSDSLETSSTRSSPLLLRHKPCDMQLQYSAHAPGNVTHCFSGLSHILSLARHFLSPCSPKRKPTSGARSFRRFFHKTKNENRSMTTYWHYQSFD